jgi:hypothetical protein
MDEPRATGTGRVSLFLWAVAFGFAVVFLAELLVRTA